MCRTAQTTSEAAGERLMTPSALTSRTAASESSCPANDHWEIAGCIHIEKESERWTVIKWRKLDYTRTQTRMHARIHTRTHAHTHARAHTHTRARAHAHARARTHTHTQRPRASFILWAMTVHLVDLRSNVLLVFSILFSCKTCIVLRLLMLC